MTVSTPLDPEIAQLQSELEKDLRFARLNHLLRLRQQYLSLPQITSQSDLPLSSETVTTNGTTNGTANGTSHESGPRSPGRRRSPEREMALQETRTFLLGRTEPTRITDIDAHLEVKGIRLNGDDPLNNLSALLSTSGQFQAHGRAGWTLSQ